MMGRHLYVQLEFTGTEENLTYLEIYKHLIYNKLECTHE